MIELIEQANSIGLFPIIRDIVIVLAVIVGGRKLWRDFISDGYKSKRVLWEQEVERRFTELESDIKKVDKRVTDTSTMYNDKLEGFHEQSIEIRGNLAEDIADVKHTQDDIKTSLLDLKHMFIDNEIDTIRFEILDFANAVMDHRNYNKEQYDHVFDIYEKYERILAENGLENGRVDMSMQFLKNKYAELMQTGFNR